MCVLDILKHNGAKLYNVLIAMLRMQLREELLMPFLQEFGEWLWAYMRQQDNVIKNNSPEKDDKPSTLGFVIYHDKIIYLGRSLLKQLLYDGDFDHFVPFVDAMYWVSIVMPAWNTVCRNVLHRHVWCDL